MRYKTIRVGEFEAVFGQTQYSKMGVDRRPHLLGAWPRLRCLIPQVFEKRSNGLKYRGWRWSTGINLVRSFLRIEIDFSSLKL